MFLKFVYFNGKNILKIKYQKVNNRVSSDSALARVLRCSYCRLMFVLLVSQSYSSVDTLLTQSRLTVLQSVQALIEIQDFLLFIKGDGKNPPLIACLRLIGCGGHLALD